jgi:hypothetical protein
MLSESNEALLFAIRSGYMLDENNNIIDPHGKIRKLCLHKGYPRFTIKFKHKKYAIDIHRLKAYHLYGDAIFENKLQVRHVNGNKLDLCDANIQLGTRQQNAMDIPEYDRRRISKNAVIYAAIKNRRFTDGEVTEIKKLNLYGISYARLAKAYKTCKSTMSYIMNNKTYGNVAQLDRACDSDSQG